MENNITIYKNGFTIRLRNRRIKVTEIDNQTAFKISCMKFEKDKDACGALSYKIKDKNIMFSTISFSEESLDAILQGYNEFLKSKAKQETSF